MSKQGTTTTKPKLKFMKEEDYNPRVEYCEQTVYMDPHFQVEDDESQLECLAKQAPPGATHVDFAYIENGDIVRGISEERYPKGDSFVSNVKVLYIKMPSDK